jgi:hypothetical protein
MRRPAPHRPLSPFLLRRAVASRINQNLLARNAGWPDYNSYYTALRSEIVIATPLTVERLFRLADLVGLARDEVFLDEPFKKRQSVDAEVQPRG